MAEKKSTGELEKILKSTHAKDFGDYLSENEASMANGGQGFSFYVKERITAKNLRLQEVFLRADISERYGYKLLSGEKKTRQRDVILRLCYAAEFTLEETQKALRLYRMTPLYARVDRDALLIIAFNTRPGSVLDVNRLLKENGMEILRPCGVQE